MPYYLSSRTEKIDMNIKPKDKTIKELLLSEHQFVIPRFQREYSWERKHYKEFLEDTLDGLIINNGTITNNQYFLGTMLFVGDCFENEQEEIVVVDGQQRLTTITILFSALSLLNLSIRAILISRSRKISSFVTSRINWL